MEWIEHIRCRFAVWQSKRRARINLLRLERLGLLRNPQGPGFVMADYTLEEALASVGKGWGPIVERLWRFCKAQNPPIMVTQVKEKLGGLRFYVGAATDDVWKVIDAGEAESLKTCEDCGQPGETRPLGWILTLCDACFMKHTKRQQEGWK